MDQPLYSFIQFCIYVWYVCVENMWHCEANEITPLHMQGI